MGNNAVCQYASAAFHGQSTIVDNSVERVQRCFTRRVYRRCGLVPKRVKQLPPFETRLERLGMTHISQQRQLIDLTLAFKIIHGHISGADGILELKPISNRPTRAPNSYQLTATRHRRKCRSKFFGNRILNTWNSLPEHVVTAEKTADFKSLLRPILAE